MFLLKGIFPQNSEGMIFLHYFVVKWKLQLNHFINLTQLMKVQLNDLYIC